MTNNWGKVGFTLSDYRAVLRNHKLQGKQFTVDPLLKEYQYDNFSLTPDYLDFIIDHINSKQLKFLHAYPSAAYIFASHLHKTGKQTTLKSCLSGSENVLPYQKQLIQDVMKIRMYTWFGHSEKLILAGENSDCENYHSNPFYGITEIIDENGRPTATAGTIGELTGTGFINTKMPFIRYKTGDFAEFVGNICPGCGHIGVTFKNIKGRWHGDKIYKADDSIITTTALNLHNGIYDYIQNVQYFQSEKGKLEVRVVPEKTFTPEVKEKLFNELMLKVGKGLSIEIVEVDKVEFSVNNKFQLLIQKIITANFAGKIFLKRHESFFAVKEEFKERF
jgi:phenylacetate-CoA ligase